MLVYDKGRLLVGIHLKHLFYIAFLSVFIFIAMFLYRENYYGFSELKKVEGGWKAKWSGAWHPWAEITTYDVFRIDKDTTWRYVESGKQAHCDIVLNREIQNYYAKALAEKFKLK